MGDDNRMVHRLYHRLVILLPWLSRCTNARVTIPAAPVGNTFALEAEWELGGEKGSYRKVFTPDTIRQEPYRCTKDVARRFIRDVLEKRGV